MRVGSRPLWIAIGLWLLIGAPAAAKWPPRPEKPMSTTIELEALRDLPPFQVTLEGTPQPSYPDERPCLYSEWTYGRKAGDGFSVSWRGDRSEAPFVVVTPRGRLEIGPNRIRPHLAPGYTREWVPAEIEKAPPHIQTALQEEQAPITVEAYCLEAGKTYWAKAEAEHYHLPPRRGEDAPRRRTNWVLVIADAPFEDGEPTRPITPGMRGWSY